MGHVKCAEAIAEEIYASEPDASVTTVDVMDYLFPHLSKAIYKGFSLLVSRLPGMYNHLNRAAGKHAGVPMKKAITARLDKLMEQTKPDLIISNLPVCSKYISAYKELRVCKQPLFTYITDITVHDEWIADKTDLYFVGDESTGNALISEGVPAEKIVVSGIPVKRAFKSAFKDAALKSQEKADGSRESGRDYMLLENSLEIYVNGLYAGTVPCTPQYMTELVLGWLRAEGFINSLQEVNSVEISTEGTRADVTLADVLPGQFAVNESGRYAPVPVKPIPWKKEWIFALAKDFEEILPLRRETMAAHNCRLARGRGDDVEILFKCEDIGRHSAIDKVIGWAMRNGVDTKDCILFTSGRVSREMVKKVIRAGIPVMAGKGTISGRAVQLAKANSLTLIGYARQESLCIFTD